MKSKLDLKHVVSKFYSNTNPN